MNLDLLQVECHAPAKDCQAKPIRNTRLWMHGILGSLWPHKRPQPARPIPHKERMHVA
ncbi:hypothetical protein DENIT_10175 [Pseudomonas veronii]|nr:hypothetical protein DENIT_10175 [Pseudomonas veronii]